MKHLSLRLFTSYRIALMFAAVLSAVFSSVPLIASGADSPTQDKGTGGDSPLILFTAISGRPGAKEAREIVQESVKAGFSQWVVYARSGLEIEYMGEEWLDFVGHMLREARSVGGHIWLYDEYNWPSGSCKGRVPMENPEWTYTEYAVRRRDDGSFDWEVKRNDQLSMYDPYYDVNAYSEDAIRRFMELTHEVYEKRFGEYFRDGTILGIFTDEPAHPSIMKWKSPEPVVAFRWWKELEAQYRELTGRDFRKDVEESLRDPSKVHVWELYTELKGRQFRRAYFDQISAWCDKMGIKLCGHMIGEGSPLTSSNWNGLPLNSICGMTLPGMDKIRINLPKSYPVRVQKEDEWLTYSTAQYGIEHNSKPGDFLSCPGGVELYALGPLDITHGQMAQAFWTCALYGMDHYFTSLYQVTALGFLEKSAYAMMASPAQPWFAHCAGLHDEARLAAKWSRKRFVRNVGVRYPQRLSGRLALKRFAPGEKSPPFNPLVRELSWGQVSFELLQEDDKSGLKHIFGFRGDKIVEERSGREFSSPEEVRDWLYSETDGLWRAVDSAGNVVPGLLVRNYADGTGVVLNLTDTDFTELRLGRGDVFDLPACGRVIFGKTVSPCRKAVKSTPVKVDSWNLSLDRPSLRRIWFTTNNTARLVVKTPIENVRWIVCDCPKGKVKISINGKLVVPDRSSGNVPFSYSGMYGETAPFTLAAGEYDLRLEGRNDGNIYLPTLWLCGRFGAREPGVVFDCPETASSLGRLSDIGLEDFAGEVTYSADVVVEGNVLALDTAGLVACVRLGGMDLGERALAPFEWKVPGAMAGKKARLEVTIVTSMRPSFGRAPIYIDGQGRSIGNGVLHGIKLDQPGVSTLNCGNEGLISAEWRNL